jgi:phage shock protein PspC (stress-responsive transcriptional regulator)
MRDERHDPLPHDQRRARRPSAATKLRRSTDDRVVAGIAAGIAAFTDADPRWVRAAFVLSLPLSLGVTGVGYLVLWAILPAEQGA